MPIAWLKKMPLKQATRELRQSELSLEKSAKKRSTCSLNPEIPLGLYAFHFLLSMLDEVHPTQDAERLEDLQLYSQQMKGDDPEFIEAIRLILKFFPEAKPFISLTTGLYWETFLSAMQTATFHADYSCYPYRSSEDPDLRLALKGGFEGDNRTIYLRLLKHAQLQPQGRAVIVFDTLKAHDYSTEHCPPIICHSRMVPKRLTELACFNQARDTLFVFECGSAILIDHDNRIHWAQSIIRKWVAQH